MKGSSIVTDVQSSKGIHVLSGSMSLLGSMPSSPGPRRLGYRVGKGPEYHFRRLLAMALLTRPQCPADNKTSPKNRTCNLNIDEYNVIKVMLRYDMSELWEMGGGVEMWAAEAAEMNQSVSLHRVKTWPQLMCCALA